MSKVAAVEKSRNDVEKPDRVVDGSPPASDISERISKRRIGRLAGVPIENLIYHANQQRRSYGMHTGEAFVTTTTKKNRPD